MTRVGSQRHRKKKVGFYYKKFNTMHSHMNVKLGYSFFDTS